MEQFKQILLASKSSRRKELMKDCGMPFRVEIQDTEEYFDDQLPIEEAIIQIAYQKAKAVSDKFPNELTLGCDTMVVLDHQALGKPANKKEARAILNALCGKTHHVISGVVLLSKDICVKFYETTEVTFYEADKAFITAYCNSEEPYDKAGAYGIQGTGKLFVKEIKGDYYNVVGLPIGRVYRELKKIRNLAESY